MSFSSGLQNVRVLLVCIFCFFVLSTIAQGSDETVLFEEGFIFNEPDSGEHVLRSRSVIVAETLLAGSNTFQQRSSDLNVSSAMDPNGANTRPASAILKLNLFEDLVVYAQLTNAYQNRSGSSTWIGKIETPKGKGTAVFVVRSRIIHGVIDIPGEGNFSIRPGPFNSHIIEEIDNSSILTGESDAVIDDEVVSSSSDNAKPVDSVAPDSARGASVAISNDDGSIIDVYVGYDQDASGGFVAQAAAQSLAELFIAYTNQAYENSGITQRVWLVGDVDGYNYTSDGGLNDLYALKDGEIAGLHAERDEHHADLVMFFRPYTTGLCWGLAFQQTTNGDISWQNNAFAVMRACSFGSAIFAHELGHSMGSSHDWYMADDTLPQTYAHGHIDTANSFRTIMSYGYRCKTAGGTCTRVAHFSNPLVNFNDQPTGIAGGTSTGCAKGDAYPAVECDADNARNFNEKAATTSKFRDSKVVWTGANDTSWSNASNWETERGAPGSTTTFNQVPRSYDNVLIPTGMVNYPTVTGNAEARELTIANGAALKMTGGTLTVGWAWDDAGGFNASAGTVKLSGPLGTKLISSSAFSNLEIGSGSDATQVALDSNLDVNGNFTINSGAKFKGGSHKINLAGDFDDRGNGFDKGTSTVIFDGASQTVTGNDNITFEGKSLLQFHNLTVSNGSTEFLKSVAVAKDFEIILGGIANFGFNNISVESIVTNNGEIRQSKATIVETNTSFVSIKNKAGSIDKYYGVEINPLESSGNTTVSVKGNQACASATGFVLRCYIITPTASGTATIKFYHRPVELNQNSAPIIKIISGSTWSAAPGATSSGGSGNSSWISSSGLIASGVFGLGDTTDTNGGGGNVGWLGLLFALFLLLMLHAKNPHYRWL